MTPNQKPLTVQEAAKAHAKSVYKMIYAPDDLLKQRSEKDFIAGADWQASLPSNDEQGQETPVDGWEEKFEEWVTKSWPENNNESARCRGAARYAMEWVADNVIRKWLSKFPLTPEATPVKSEPNDKQGWIDDDPFPLKDVLKILVRGVEILLDKKDYDGPDYEEMNICVKRAKEIMFLLSPPQSNTIG